MKRFAIALSLVALVALSACAPGNAVDNNKADSAFYRSSHK